MKLFQKKNSLEGFLIQLEAKIIEENQEETECLLEEKKESGNNSRLACGRKSSKFISNSSSRYKNNNSSFKNLSATSYHTGNRNANSERALLRPTPTGTGWDSEVPTPNEVVWTSRKKLFVGLMTLALLAFLAFFLVGTMASLKWLDRSRNKEPKGVKLGEYAVTKPTVVKRIMALPEVGSTELNKDKDSRSKVLSIPVVNSSDSLIVPLLSSKFYSDGTEKPTAEKRFMAVPEAGGTELNEGKDSRAKASSIPVVNSSKSFIIPPLSSEFYSDGTEVDTSEKLAHENGTAEERENFAKLASSANSLDHFKSNFHKSNLTQMSLSDLHQHLVSLSVLQNISSEKGTAKPWEDFLKPTPTASGLHLSHPNASSSPASKTNLTQMSLSELQAHLSSLSTSQRFRPPRNNQSL